jgi:2'-5' RNA ligase
MDTIWRGFYDVVIFPREDVRDYAIELSEKLHRDHATAWKLDADNRKPHLSLLHFPMNPQRTLESLAESLTAISIGRINLAGISSPRDGAIFLDVERSASLLTASRVVTSTIWDGGWAVEDPLFMERWRRADLTPRMMENIRAHHSPWMEEDFLPHFTLGGVDKERAVQIAASLPFRQMSWDVSRLHIVQVGPGWTAGSVLAEIRLR